MMIGPTGLKGDKSFMNKTGPVLKKFLNPGSHVTHTASALNHGLNGGLSGDTLHHDLISNTSLIGPITIDHAPPE
jgi:hypothetical protein